MPPPQSFHLRQIEQRAKEFSQYYIQAEYDKLVSVYLPEGSILPPGSKEVKGREAIKKKWVLPEGVKVLAHRSEAKEVKIMEDYAYDVGEYYGKSQQADGTVREFQGNYIIIWKRVEGQWFIAWDIWNRF